MTKVSIIVPVYNVEEYLKECLDSLVKQTLTDLEFICINDGSTDSSLEILNEYAKKDGRFIILSRENQGQGVARNNAIQISKGEYIAFLDPDDWVELNALEILYNFAKEKNAQIVQFNYKEYNQYSRAIKNISFAQKVKKTYNYDLSETPYYNWRNLKKDCLCELDLHVWAHFYNTNFIKNNNIVFAPSKRGEDHLFANGAKLLADKVYYLDEYLYYYRCREGSAVNTKGDDNFCVFDNIKKLEEFIKEHNLWEELKEEFTTYTRTILTWHYEQNPIERIKEYEEICKKILSEKDFKKMLKSAKRKRKFIENIFSLKNKRENAIKYKVLTIFGISFVIKPKQNRGGK